MNQKNEIAKMSETVTKKIVDNVNNVLGILPQPLSFEFNRSPKLVRRRKAKASSSRRPSKARKARTSTARAAKKAKRAGARLQKRAKSAVTSARRSAAARKAHRPSSRRKGGRVIPMKRAHKSQSHSRAA